jgi:hypothetical protein
VPPRPIIYSSSGTAGPPGVSAVVSRQSVETQTLTPTPFVALTTAPLDPSSKVKARLWVIATGIDDPTSNRWWEIETTFRRNPTGPAAESGPPPFVTGGQEGGGSPPWDVTLGPSVGTPGALDVTVTGAPFEVKWTIVLLVEVLATDCFCTYRVITVGAAPLSASWSGSQLCTSVQRGPSYFSKYFRFSATVGQTITAFLNGGGIDTYLYLLKGTDKYGSLLAFDDDSGGGLSSKIIYTIGPGDGGDFVLDCTTYAPNTAGSFAISVV